MGARDFDRALRQIRKGTGSHDAQLRTQSTFDLKGSVGNHAEESGEAVDLTRDGLRGRHSGKIRAVAIVGHHQWCARLELIANRLVDRNRLSARAQRLAGNVFECDGNDRFRVGTSRQSVGGDLQGTREKIGNLHPFLKAHRSRTNLGRIRI